MFKLIRYMEEDGEEIKPEHYSTREKLDNRIDELRKEKDRFIEGEDYEIEEIEVN